MKAFPKRPSSHVGGDRAVQAVVAHCDPAWIITSVAKDYGLDLRVEITQNGLVTGEEFFVQVKGRTKIDTDREYPPRASVRQATINYWLGKLSPTLIVVVDLSNGVLAFDWLQYAYAAYPQLGTGESEVGLPLSKNSGSHEFRQEILAYLRQYYAVVRRDVQDGSQNLYLTRILFHVSALFRVCARTAIELQRLDSDDPNDYRQLVHAFVTAFAAHDEILAWLREGRFTDSRAAGESRILSLVGTLLALYDQGRDKLFQRQDREDGFWKIRPDYSGLAAYLLPTFGVLHDLEEILFQGLMLGKLVYVPGEASDVAHGA
ncbi:MAG: DUF4365 domain-containing protein [Deltaproteobacteria bacterium]|nr:DUF4365 domain-containing protein [Deltaproteobacteria bacterium]